MTDKIRIAQLVGNAELGGVSNCVLNYYKAIDKSRFQFVFITYGESSLDIKIKEEGGEIRYIHDFRRFPQAIKDLKAILKEEKFDIFHSHLTSLSLFPLYVAYRAGIKSRICHAHSTTDNKEATSVVKNILKKLSVKYATDNFACGKLSAEWFFGSDKNVFIMPNAINTERFAYDEEKRESVRKKYGIEGLCMGFAGRFEYQKNLEFFLKVAEEVQKETKSVAVLVGGGSQKESLERFAKENGINAVFIEGQDRIEDFYSAFDCLVMPSRYEGLPLVGVECQASGLPCFFSETITRETDCGKAEFLPADEPQIWAERICKFRYGDREAPPLITEKFDIKKAAKLLEKVYTDLAVKNGR